MYQKRFCVRGKGAPARQPRPLKIVRYSFTSEKNFERKLD
jgi:hypothetical protein